MPWALQKLVLQGKGLRELEGPGHQLAAPSSRTHSLRTAQSSFSAFSELGALYCQGTAGKSPKARWRVRLDGTMNAVRPELLSQPMAKPSLVANVHQKEAAWQEALACHAQDLGYS